MTSFPKSLITSCFVLFLSLSSSIIRAQDAEDIAALTALYNSTDGANWANTWDLSGDPNDWYGVTWENERVVIIDLNGKNLNGIIPAEIGKLNNLLSLNLESNQLVGVIPSEFGNLVSLESLSLNANQLTGSIPVEIGNMISLKDVRLANNQLSESIPSEIGNLTNLRVLHLFNNNLSGTIPSEIGILNNLRSLNLGSNQLAGVIPSEFGNLVSLESLSLNSNQLTGSIPVEIGNMISLKDLRLVNNQLSESIPSEIGNLTNLRALHLFNNNLSGPIPSEFGSLTNLQTLLLSTNQLSGIIPSEIEQLTNLISLELHDNQFNFASFETIGSLLSTIGAVDISPQKNLLVQEAIIISPIGSEIILSVDTEGNNNLYQWYFNGVSVSEVSESSEYIISSVTENDLGIYYCEVTNTVVTTLTLITDVIKVQTETTVLSQEDALIALYNATDGANWTITWDLDDEPSGWHGVTWENGYVTKIELTTNKLKGSLPSEIGGLSNLKEFSLYNNQLTGTIPSEIGSLYILLILNLSANQLEGSIPPEIGGLNNLQILSLGSNKLNGDIPSELGDLSKLENLSLSINQLSGIIPTEIGNMTNLNSLSLTSNQLSGNIPTEIGNMTNLNSLAIGQNELTGEIPLELFNLTKLESLVLDHNELTGSIPPEIGNLTNLRILTLYDNQFTGIIPKEIENLSNMYLFWVHDNRFDFSSFEHISDFLNTIFDLSIDSQSNIFVPQPLLISEIGSEVLLSIDTGGDNNLYQWYLDGNSIGAVSSSSEYVIVSLAKDDIGTYHCEVTNTIITTLTLSSEDILLSYPIEFTNTPTLIVQKDHSVDLEAIVNKDAELYYVALTQVELAPSAEQIIAGTDAADEAVSSRGSINVVAETISEFTINGLNDQTLYDIYLVARDEQDLVSDVAALSVETITGLFDHFSSKELNIYPNPTNHNLYIDIAFNESCNIVITDMKGQQLLEFKGTLKAINIDVSNLQRGVYLLNITSGNKSGWTSFVKE